MNLSGIISIGGMSGLFKIVAQIKNGVLVESLIDKKRVPAYSTHKVSELENITIYSTGDNVPLKDVFQKIYTAQNGGTSIDHKLPDTELRKYFKSVFPDYDEERVYVSDIKKVISWYNLLQKEGLLEVKESKEEKVDEKPKVKTTSEKETKAPKKASAKNTATKAVKTAGTKVKVAGVRKTGVA